MLIEKNPFPVESTNVPYKNPSLHYKGKLYVAFPHVVNTTFAVEST